MSHQDIIQTLIEWIDEHSVPSPTKRWVITFASAGYCSPLRR